MFIITQGNYKTLIKKKVLITYNEKTQKLLFLLLIFVVVVVNIST